MEYNLGTHSHLTVYEWIQSALLRAIIGVLRCISNVILRLEAGLASAESQTLSRMLITWVRVTLNPGELLLLLLMDKYKDNW